MTYSIYSDFDIEKHKETFDNYLELIINADGTVHYAVPSHQEFLIRKLCKERNLTRDELNNLCPKKYWINFMDWLLDETGCISVWDTFYLTPEDGITAKQWTALKQLKEAGLYKGTVD